MSALLLRIDELAEGMIAQTYLPNLLLIRDLLWVGNTAIGTLVGWDISSSEILFSLCSACGEAIPVRRHIFLE